jgi:hypothetical protein
MMPSSLQSWHRLGTRALLLAMTLSGLFLALLSAQMRVGHSAPDERRKLIDTASALLQGLPPRPVIHDDTLRVAAMLEPLRNFARENAGSVTRVAALDADVQERMPRPNAKPNPAPHAPPPEVQTAPGALRIPDAIEGAVAPPGAIDALSALTVSTYLRTLDGRSAPFALESIRTNPGPARVRIQLRSSASAALAPAAWYEIGEAPLPGWRIVSITANSLVVLTPLGNPMRLGMSADAR